MQILAAVGAPRRRIVVVAELAAAGWGGVVGELCWRRLEDCRAERRVWLGERSRGRRSRGKNRRRSRSRNWRKKRLELEESRLPLLNEVAEGCIVCIAILACLLSYPEIVKKNIFIKLNIVFENVHDVSGGCGGVEMVV